MSTVSRMREADAGLYYPKGDAQAFWSSVKELPLYAEVIAEIRKEGERLSGTPIPDLPYSLFSLFARTGTRREYEQPYFERRRILNTMAILSLLEPEHEPYIAALSDIVWAICNEYTWCLPAHLGDGEAEGVIDLFSAETGFALSEICLLLCDRLPALVINRLRAEVNRRIFIPYLTKGPYHWETATHNWSAVCSGSIGSAALLMLKDTELLTDIIAKVQDAMGYYLNGFGEDGACLEGLGYWTYGFGFFVYYADLLRQRSNGKLDWFQLDKVRSIATFQQKCFLGGDSVANFSDSRATGHVFLGLSHYLSSMYPEVETPPLSLRAPFTEDHCSRWPSAIRNLIWLQPGLSGSEWGSASCYLPDAKWLLSRHIGTSGAFGFAAKGGNNDEPHNHNDLGSFVLLGEGQFCISELGSGEYTAGYFGAERYSYDCNGSQGHSVPIIDGQFQVPGAEAYADVLEAAAGEAESILVLDLTRAYPYEGLQRLKRSFRWQTDGIRPTLTMTDEFRFTEVPAELTERLVTFCQPVLDEGSLLLNSGGQGILRIIYDNQVLVPEITVHTYRGHFGVAKTWYGLDFHALKPGNHETYGFEFQFIDNSN